MLKLNKQILEKLYQKDLRSKYPTVPDYAMPSASFSDKTANGLTKCIKYFLNESGHQAERIASGGRVIDGRNTTVDAIGRTVTVGSTKYIKGTSTDGTADISSTIFGISVKIEVKIGKDRQSEAQKKYQKDVERSGGVYVIAKCFDTFLEWYLGFVRLRGKVFTSKQGVEFIVTSKHDKIVQRLDTFESIKLTESQFKPYSI